jgi:hypothetical protein
MMTPTVMDFGNPPFMTSQIAFISFENASQVNRDGGGVLRVIDGNCKEIATFPDTSLPPPTIPPSCPSNLASTPRLAPASGLAVGNVDANSDVEIVALLDDPNGSSNHYQIVTFNLVGPLNAARLVPKACSAPLLSGDFIPGPSAPAIAQLDIHPGPTSSDIVIHNKVFEMQGTTLTLRYSGLTGPGSRTVVVGKTSSSGSVPDVIAGRGAYHSLQPTWTGTPGWVNGSLSNSSLVFPAIAELDTGSPGPEIIVTDTMKSTLNVLSSTGTLLASTTLSNGVAGCPGPSCPCPGPTCPKCGGPPMIGDVDGVPGPEIGVASCTAYTVYRYTPGVLSVVWWQPTNDPGGQTTATLFPITVGSTRVYYADATTFWVFYGTNGNALLCTPNSSNTAIEGPVIAAFDTAPGQGQVILTANNYHLSSGGQHGVRIFSDPAIGRARSYWNQHTYHATNVTNSTGNIPTVEPPSWLSPALNTYGVQQAPP